MPFIMEPDDTESRMFRPKAKFGVTVRAGTGTIGNNWFVYYSDNNGVHWEKAHETAFSETDKNATFEVPAGLVCQVRGGEGSNLYVFVGYVGTINSRLGTINSDLVAEHRPNRLNPEG